VSINASIVQLTASVRGTLMKPKESADNKGKRYLTAISIKPDIVGKNGFPILGKMFL